MTEQVPFTGVERIKWVWGARGGYVPGGMAAERTKFGRGRRGRGLFPAQAAMQKNLKHSTTTLSICFT